MRYAKKMNKGYVFSLLVLETGFLCGALAILELTLETRLESHSEICLPLSPPKWNKVIFHCTLDKGYIFLRGEEWGQGGGKEGGGGGHDHLHTSCCPGDAWLPFLLGFSYRVRLSGL